MAGPAPCAPSSLPNAVRVILRPPAGFRLTLGLRSGGQSYELRIADGWIDAARGEIASCELSLAGSPIDVIAALVTAEADDLALEIDGDRELLSELRSMVVIPEHLREEALDAVSSGLVATAGTA